MEYRYLGNTGLRVSNLCLGTMTFGASANRPGQADEALSHQILDAFVAAGGNFVDTADVYQMGLSEEIIGTWLDKKKTKGDKAGEEEGEDEEEWSQTEQMALEAALAQFPKGTTERWERIVAKVPGKSKEECMARFKRLAEVVKARKATAAVTAVAK